MCGEVLPSRTHWYRHKYKLHVPNSGQPSPLFQCEQCNAFFKSRKGYIGHLSSRHSTETEELTLVTAIKQEPDIDVEIGIPTNELFRDYKKSTKIKVPSQIEFIPEKPIDWEEQREREEKLVSDIINRVRMECEQQGTTVTRRGYSRRSTVMNT